MQHGNAQLIVEFNLGKDLDIAAQDVRDKVSLARRALPPELEPPVVEKVDTDGAFAIVWVPVKISDRTGRGDERVRPAAASSRC